MVRVLLISVLLFGVLVPSGSTGWAAPSGAQEVAEPAMSLTGVQPLEVCPDPSEVVTGFTDVAGNVHLEAISCLVWAGVTEGVEPGRYAPASVVTRGQMATFLVRMLDAHGVVLAEGDPAVFEDVAGTAHQDAIGQLVEAGITQGTSPSTFDPGAAVTRGQMAAFLVRTVEQVIGAQLAVGEVSFTDTVGTTHELAVAKAAGAGLAAGVSAQQFAPGGEVRRDQMASFVARTLSYLAVNDPGLDLPQGLLPGGPERTPGAADPRPGIVEFELGESTVQVDATSTASLDGSTLRIGVDELDEPEVGGYLVGYATEELEFGLHHRVAQVERDGEMWVVELEPATLGEPYEQLELDVTVEPNEASMQELVDALNDAALDEDGPAFTATLVPDEASDPLTTGARSADAALEDAWLADAPSDPRTFPGPTIELKLTEPEPNRRGQRRDGLTIPWNGPGRVWLKLEMSLRPSVDLAFDGGGWFSGPDHALVALRLEAEVTTGIGGTLEAGEYCDLLGLARGDDGTVDTTTYVDCNQQIVDGAARALERAPTNPLDLLEDGDVIVRLEQLAERFPTTVSIEPRLHFERSLAAEGLMQASVSSWVVVGARYDDGPGLSGILDYPDSPTVDLEGQATFNARAEAGLRLRVMIANAFGPTITGSLFGEVEAGVMLTDGPGWDAPFFDRWAAAGAGVNVRAQLGIQDPFFGVLSTSWTVYEDDLIRWDVYRSRPPAPVLRLLQGAVLEWREPRHATRYAVAVGPAVSSCATAARQGNAPDGARRVAFSAQTPYDLDQTRIHRITEDWDTVHACVAAVDATPDRISPASNSVVVSPSATTPEPAPDPDPQGGQTWRQVPSDQIGGSSTDAQMHSVVAGGPGYVSVGRSDSAAAVWTSSDGLEWQRVPHDDATFGAAFDRDNRSRMSSVVVGGPGLVAVGHYGGRDQAAVWTSPDGLQWQRVPHDEAMFGGGSIGALVAWGPGLVAVGSSGGRAAVWTSPDGLQWQRVPHDEAMFGNGAMASVVAGGPGLVAVGNSGELEPRAVVWTSSDAREWQRVAHDEDVFGDGAMSSVVAGGPGLVAVGMGLGETFPAFNAAVWTSPDGLEWQRVPHDEAVFGGWGQESMSSVTLGGPGLVAVGQAGRRGPPGVWTSPDGLDWERVLDDESNFGVEGTMFSVVADGPQLVAVGEKVVRSLDGALEFLAAVWVSP